MLWAVWRHSTSGKDRVGRGRKTNGFGPVWKRRPRKSSKKPFAKRECGIRKDIRDGWRWSMATKRNWRSSASASTKKATIRGLFSTSSMWPSGCGRPVWISIKKERRNWKPGFQTAAGYSQRADRARGRRYAPQRHTSSFRRARATANRLLCGLLAQIQEEHAVRPVSENGITDRHWRHRRRMSVSGPRPNGSYGSALESERG